MTALQGVTSSDPYPSLQRRHGNANEADDEPLALRARKVENTVGGLGRRLEERPEA